MLAPPLQNSAAPRDHEPDADLHKVLQWQAARRERILRGEYQSHLLRLSELVSRVRKIGGFPFTHPGQSKRRLPSKNR